MIIEMLKCWKKAKKKLKCIQGQKFVKKPFIIYADTECLLEKNEWMQN